MYSNKYFLPPFLKKTTIRIFSTPLLVSLM